MGKKGKQTKSSPAEIKLEDKLGADEIFKWNMNVRGEGTVHFRSRKFRYEFEGKTKGGLPHDGVLSFFNGPAFKGKVKTILPKKKMEGVARPQFLYSDNSGILMHSLRNGRLKTIQGKFMNSVLKGPVTIEMRSAHNDGPYMKQIGENSVTMQGRNGIVKVELKPGKGETLLVTPSKNGKEQIVMIASGDFKSFNNVAGRGSLEVSRIPFEKNNSKNNRNPTNFKFTGKFKMNDSGLLVPDGPGIKSFANGRIQLLLKNGLTKNFASEEEMLKFKANMNRAYSTVQLMMRAKLSRNTIQSQMNAIAKQNKLSNTFRNKVIESSNRTNFNLQKKLRSISKSYKTQANKSFLNYLKQDPDDCAICSMEMASGDPLAQTACKHKFHAGCLLEFYRRKPNYVLKQCPVCRANVNHARKSETKSSFMLVPRLGSSPSEAGPV